MKILILLPALALLATVRAGWKSPNSAFRELMRAALTSLWDFTSDQILDEVRTESLRAAGFQDTDDCAKKLLCELARKSKFDSKIDSLPEIPNASSFPGGAFALQKSDLAWDEKLLMRFYHKSLDYDADSLFFNLAVQIGKRGERFCHEVYPNYLMDLEEMRDILRRQGITFDIPGIDRDCQVYLFWKKNEDSSEIAVNPGDFQEDAVQK